MTCNAIQECNNFTKMVIMKSILRVTFTYLTYLMYLLTLTANKLMKIIIIICVRILQVRLRMKRCIYLFMLGT